MRNITRPKHRLNKDHNQTKTHQEHKSNFVFPNLMTLVPVTMTQNQGHQNWQDYFTHNSMKLMKSLKDFTYVNVYSVQRKGNTTVSPTQDMINTDHHTNILTAR